MDPWAVILLVLLAVLIGYTLIRPDGESREGLTADQAAWDRAASSEEDLVGRILVGVSRPLAETKAVRDAAASPQWRWLDQKLGAAGGVFGSSVEVFLCVQLAALILAGAMIVLLLAFQAEGGPLLAGGLFAISLAVYPYNILTSRGKKRARLINRELPDFAELLQMPLNSGFGIIPALNFTAKDGEGPVSVEVRAMLAKMRAKPGNDAGAFTEAGRNLGTPEAMSFFNALAQAHIEGAKVARNLAAQAAALRVAAYEQSRADNLKLPTKLIVVCGLHLMPMLLVVALLPAIAALKDL